MMKLVVPVPKPYTRVKIKPGVRHTDRKNDYRRKPKHARRGWE